jgi:hypothetical protein
MGTVGALLNFAGFRQKEYYPEINVYKYWKKMKIWIVLFHAAAHHGKVSGE